MIKLTVEDVNAIPSKTSYMDGKCNTIHYFGKKPKEPETLRNYLKQKKTSESK